MKHTVLVTTWISLVTILGCGQGAPQSNLGQPGSETSAPAAPSAPEGSRADSPPTAESSSASVAVTAPKGDLSDGNLWRQLQQAETHYFVLMRHALAPGTGDPANFQLDDCSTQRNLNEVGREQSRRTGEKFRQQDITVSQVLSSQWCRCMETAELLGLGEVEPFPALNSFFQDRSTAEAQTEQVRQFMLDHPGTPGVTVMVTHFVNIAALSQTNVSSGEMMVMRVNDQNQVVVVGPLEAL